MAIRNRGLFSIALEDNEGVLVLNPAEGAENEIKTVSACDDLDVTADEIGNITGTIDNATNWVDDLMRVGDSLDKSAIAGVGIDEVSLEPTMIAVEAICYKLGLESMMVFPSLESFKSPSTRIISTHVVVEKISDTVKKAKDTIVRLFKALIEKMKELGKKFMEIMMNVIPRHLKSLEKRIEALPDSKEALEIHDKGLIRAFGKKGQTKVSVAEVEKVLKFPDGAESILMKRVEMDLANVWDNGDIGEMNSDKDDLLYDSIIKEGHIVARNDNVSDNATIEVASKEQMKVFIREINEFLKKASGLKIVLAKADASLKKAMAGVTDENFKKGYELAAKKNGLFGAYIKLYGLTAKEGTKYLERCITARKKAGKK